jgi:hypothetical protein
MAQKDGAKRRRKKTAQKDGAKRRRKKTARHFEKIK